MIEALEVPEIRRRALPVSVEAWHEMQERGLVSERAELIRGVIIDKMSKSPLHVLLTDQLCGILRQRFAGRYWVRQECPLTLADSEPEPDVSVVTGSRTDYARKHPATALLVVEVSISSEAGDREMLGAYAAAGVSEVWLVLGARQQVERFTLPAAGRYSESRLFAAHETLTSTVLADFSLPLDTLFPPRTLT